MDLDHFIDLRSMKCWVKRRAVSAFNAETMDCESYTLTSRLEFHKDDEAILATHYFLDFWNCQNLIYIKYYFTKSVKFQMTPPKHELWYSLTDKKIGTSWNFLTISCRVLTKGHLHLNKAENMFKLYYYAARRYSYIVFIVAFITIYYIIGLLLFMLLSELYNIFFKQCKILVSTSVNYFQGNFFSSC